MWIFQWCLFIQIWKSISISNTWYRCKLHLALLFLTFEKYSLSYRNQLTGTSPSTIPTTAWDTAILGRHDHLRSFTYSLPVFIPAHLFCSLQMHSLPGNHSHYTFLRSREGNKNKEWNIYQRKITQDIHT